jgi:YfiH family protein
LSEAAQQTRPGVGAEAFQFTQLDRPLVRHGISTRHGGVSAAPFGSLNLSVMTGDDRDHIEQNRRMFERRMGIETRQAAMGRLTHGNAVTVFNVGHILPLMAPPDLGWPMFESDAAISNVPGLILIMTFADCVPIMLWDERNRACAMIHAGWRGTALRIASTTVRAMTDAFGTEPDELIAGIGPSIGPECYPVGDEVREGFRTAYGNDADRFLGQGRLDLWHANGFDLEAAGLHGNHIEVAGICTACHTDQFFSYRAEKGSTGRFGGCIGVRYPGRFGDAA